MSYQVKRKKSMEKLAACQFTERETFPAREEEGRAIFFFRMGGI